MNIATVGVVGAGTMGAGIAQNIAEHGIRVLLHDVDPRQLAGAVERIAASLDRAVARGRMEAPVAAAARARLAPAEDLATLAAADLVIEAVFEDLEVKRLLLERLAPLLRPDTVVATNTSALSVAELAQFVPAPGRFLGMHYFSPAAVNRLVEVVRGPATDAAVYRRMIDFARATGKEPLPCRDGLGFVVNRFFCPFVNEAARLADEGFEPASVDRVARQVYAAAMGPFAVMNMTKPRIALNAQQSLARLGPFYAPAPGLERVGGANAAWIVADRAPPLSRAEEALIALRLRAAVFLPTLQLIDEEIAAPPAVDLGARLALRWDDPPVAMMDRLGRDAVAATLRPILARYRIEPPASLARVGALHASAGADPRGTESNPA